MGNINEHGFIQSKYIKVNPCAHRDSKNIEARLNSEANYINGSARGLNDSYVISAVNNVFEVILKGYYFKFILSNEDSTFKYIGIRIESAPIDSTLEGDLGESQFLANVTNGSLEDLDVEIGNDYYFKGAMFFDEVPTPSPDYSITASIRFRATSGNANASDAFPIKSSKVESAKLGYAITSQLTNGSGSNSIQQIGNTASGTNTVAFGEGTIASTNNSFVVGKYNDATNFLFAVGNGADGDHRQNAFGIKTDGSVIINGLVDNIDAKELHIPGGVAEYDIELERTIAKFFNSEFTADEVKLMHSSGNKIQINSEGVKINTNSLVISNNSVALSGEIHLYGRSLIQNHLTVATGEVESFNTYTGLTLQDQEAILVQLGNANTPIYINEGKLTKAALYAGGTAITLNGVSKASNTATFYAPVEGGISNNQILKWSSGSARPIWHTLCGETTTGWTCLNLCDYILYFRNCSLESQTGSNITIDGLPIQLGEPKFVFISVSDSSSLTQDASVFSYKSFDSTLGSITIKTNAGSSAMEHKSLHCCVIFQYIANNNNSPIIHEV